jgi:hypothetical protein
MVRKYYNFFLILPPLVVVVTAVLVLFQKRNLPLINDQRMASAKLESHVCHLAFVEIPKFFKHPVQINVVLIDQNQYSVKTAQEIVLVNLTEQRTTNPPSLPFRMGVDHHFSKLRVCLPL